MAKKKPVKREKSKTTSSTTRDEGSEKKKPTKKTPKGKKSPYWKSSSNKQELRQNDQISDVSQEGFPIVGVGASAGGLKALQTLLGAMPDEPGVAIVVVQHLDPTKKSLGPELLAKCTKMQVAEVEDDPCVKPNRVYVLPPDKYLSIVGGELHLSEPDTPRGARRAIDFFLRSLADDQHQCAVGVILSGSGTDGTLGVKAIKAAGGLVIAQDPTTAEHDSMPRSAIASGVVDHALPPEEIPGVLVRYAEHSYVLEGPAPAPVGEEETAAMPAKESHDGIEPIIAFLRANTKHDFRSYKDKTLVRRTRRRMCLHHIHEYDQYLKYLREHPGEGEALVKDVLIRVTDFFREPEAWEELRKLAIRPMIEAKEDDESIRVWTPGCATGEEPYSLSMLILEELKRAEKNCPLCVFASDIDKDAIQFAREGRYPRSIEADVSPGRLRQFFASVDGEDYYRVNKSLREVVTFADQNLIADPPFSKLDLLCCRNLLIYLKGDVQQKIIALFHFALREGGVLFLGSAETIGRQSDLFATLHKRWRIFRRVGPTQHDRVDIPISDVRQRREIDIQPAPPARRETRLSHLAQQRLLDMLAPSAVVVDAKWRILYICGDVDPYLSLKPGVPSVDLLDNARRGLRSKLRVVVQRALSEDRPVSIQARVQRDGAYHPVTMTVRVIHDSGEDEDLALVMFEESGEKVAQRGVAGERSEPPDGARKSGDKAGGSLRSTPATQESQVAHDDDLDDQLVIRQLEEELAATKDDLQATVEQLESSNEEFKALNEEVMSINEELQSTNEELETSKEELQSLNEELSTVNNQLASKVDELEVKNADLQNLLTATDVATICLDTNLAIRWFTPAVGAVIRLREADKGRPLADFTDDFTDGNLVKVARQVLDKLTPVEDEARCEDGRTFVRRVTPYRTDDHGIGGAVITFFDITERKKAENAIATAKEMAEKIVDAVSESMLVLDVNLRVMAANQSFYEKFQVEPTETEAQLVYELGNNQWDIPELRRLLEHILPENSVFQDYEVDHVFETIGRRVMRLNARRIDHIQRILLTIEDITGRKQAELELTDLNARLEQQVKERTEVLGFLQDVTRTANEASNVEEALRAALTRIARYNDWQVGHVWQLADDDSGDFVSSGLWYETDQASKAIDKLDRFKQMCAEMRISSGKCMVGAVFESLAPKWIDSVGDFDEWTRDEDEDFGLRAAIAFPITIEDGRVVAIMEFFSDRSINRGARFMEVLPDIGIQLGHVFKRQQAERSLHVSEERRRAILNAAPDAIISTDSHGVITDANPAAEEIFGYRVEELLGRNVSMLMPSPYRHEHDAYIARYLQTRQAEIIGVSREIVGQRKDGGVVPIRININEVANLGLFVGIVHDISLEKELEKQVVDASAEEQRRIAGDVHDGVGQELTGLRYMAQTHAETLAAQSSAETKTAKRMVDWLETVQRQLRHIIRELVPVEIDRHGLATALRGLAERTSEVHNVECTFECDHTVTVSDAALAAHVFRIAQEAVRNAVKHAQASQIRIQLMEENRLLRLEVDDDGIGIDGNLQKIAGFGLRSMAYRAGLIGANFTVRRREEGGTRVTCTVLWGGEVNSSERRMPEADDLTD